jgi:hypothetical protein
MVTPGVEVASLVLSSASRVRLKSFEWVTTAPPVTSPMCWPFRPYASTIPFRAAVIMSRFDKSA